MELIESHCHLDAEAFDHDREAVLARANHAGVRHQIIPAVTCASWPKLKQVCALEATLHPAYGLHPMFLDAHRPAHLDELAQWLERERPVAVGECGLDFHVEGLDPDAQQSYFDGQLRLARDFDLPLVIHARRALDQVMAALRKVGGLRGVVHSFSGSPEQARQLWKLGFHLGLGGPVTHERAQRLRRVVADMPLEQLLLETDAPDQPDAMIRGQRNEPARLPYICEVIAGLRGQSPETVAEQTSRNARDVFKLPA